MIGIGIGPDGKPFLAQPPPAAPRFPTPPRVETRVPGAPDTLPANPLSELSADDVDSFIEFKLLESDSDLAAGAARAADAASDVPITEDGPAVAPRRDTAAIRLERLTTKLPPGLQRLIAKVPPPTQRRIVRVAPYVGIALVGLVVGLAVRGKPAAPPPVVTAAAPAAPALARAAEPEPPPAAPKADEPPAPAAVPARAAPTPAPKLAAAEKPAAPQKVAAAEKAALRKVEKPAAAEAPAPAEAPAAAPRAAAAGPGACTARVITEPKDVKVIWGGTLIGSTPLAGARVPCGPATVSLERERWQVATVDVNAEAGVAASVHERLHRPRGTIAFTSSPPGAQIIINRVAAGTAPKQVDVQRYEKLQIKATLKGYAPWTKNVYLKDPESAIDIQLSARK
jgi:hypothetical protein